MVRNLGAIKSPGEMTAQSFGREIIPQIRRVTSDMRFNAFTIEPQVGYPAGNTVFQVSAGHVDLYQIPHSPDFSTLIAAEVARQVQGLEERIIQRLSLGEVVLVEPDEAVLTEAVRQFFSENDGGAFDAEDVATHLGLPVSSVVRAMDKIEAMGCITVA